MNIPPRVRAERRRMLCSVFECLKKYYIKQPQGRKKIAWSGGRGGALDDLDHQWDSYVQKLSGVRAWIMQGTDGEIEWHKLIAMTQYNILETLPLTFDDKDTSNAKNYRLNVDCAYLFGLGTMQSWYERWYEVRLLEFDIESFMHTFTNTKQGLAFKQKHHELLVSMLGNKPSFPSLFMASQLWSDVGQWGLAIMKLDKN